MKKMKKRDKRTYEENESRCQKNNYKDTMKEN